jgi:hypothetical protein
MSTIIESSEAHYETLEVPFGRIYHWHQAYVTLECDCGEMLTFSGTSAILSCRCGAAYGALVHVSTTEKSIWATRMNTPGTTISKVRRLNTYETKLLIPRAPRALRRRHHVGLCRR